MRISFTASTVLLLVTSILLASVFAYYPLTIQVQPVSPGVEFEAGSNAGKPDIGEDNYITIEIGSNKVSASIKIHPTYQENYYRDVLRIVNNDDNAMKVYLIFKEVNKNLPRDSIVKLFVYESDTKVKELDITSQESNTAILIGTLNADSTWQIDFYVKIPEGNSISNASYTASADLVYTPSGETPPNTPSVGR